MKPLTGALVLAAFCPAILAAQDFDRSQAPAVPPPSGLALPAVQQARLPNGITLRVVPMREVPLVQVNLLLKGGGRLDGTMPGLATFTAGMLDEGAGSRTAFEISAEAAFLGADLSTGADWNYLYVTLNAPRRTIGPALDLVADLVLHPSFKAADIARERDLRLARILQQRDQPSSLASLAFMSIVFPDPHPYHRPLGGDSSATAQLDSAVVRDFWQRVARPDQAEFIITGDISLAEAQAEIARRFGDWKPAQKATPEPPAAPAVSRPAGRAIFLVDKPGAAQSVIIIGGPGVSRIDPDYAAIEVMNTILGGSFSSRLNQNLRETRGYTYGARSGFSYDPVPGPFRATAAVRTNVTDSSLVEFFVELNAIRDQPVSEVELTRAKNYIAFGLPGAFETTREMAGQIAEVTTYGLPLTWYDSYVKQVLAVTAADVQRVAWTTIDPNHVYIVVVGDAEKIRPGLEALGLGPVILRTPDGLPVAP